MPFSLRLDPDTERQIRELADATGRTKSAVVREAVAQYAAAEGAPTPPAARTALERMRAYVGIADSGGAQLSHRTHEKYQAALEEKHRARSTGRRRSVHRAARSK